MKRLTGYILNELVPLQECSDAGMKPLDLIWVDTDKSVDPTRKKIRSRLCAREYKTKKQGKIQRALPASQLFSAMPPLEAVKVLVSIMMSVSLSSKGTTIEVETLRHQQSTFTRNRPVTRLHQTSRRGSSEVWRRQSWQIDQELYGTQDASHIWQLDYVNLICGELGGFRSAALFHNPSQDVRMAVHGDDFVCLSDDNGLKHIDSLLKSKYTAKDMGTLGFEDSDVKSLLLLNRVFRVGVDQTGQYLDIEPDLRHAPLIISESGCDTNTEAVSTPREKLQDKLVLDGRRRSGSEERRSNTIQICLHETFILGPRQIGLKIERQSDSSTANSLTDRLGAGQRTKRIDTRHFWIQERVQDEDLSIKKVPAAKNCADVGAKPVSASVLQQHCKFAGLVFY